MHLLVSSAHALNNFPEVGVWPTQRRPLWIHALSKANQGKQSYSEYSDFGCCYLNVIKLTVVLFGPEFMCKMVTTQLCTKEGKEGGYEYERGAWIWGTGKKRDEGKKKKGRREGKKNNRNNKIERHRKTRRWKAGTASTAPPRSKGHSWAHCLPEKCLESAGSLAFLASTSSSPSRPCSPLAIHLQENVSLYF